MIAIPAILLAFGLCVLGQKLETRERLLGAFCVFAAVAALHMEGRRHAKKIAFEAAAAAVFLVNEQR